MHAGRHYTAKEVFFWTLRETLVFIALATASTAIWAFDVVKIHLPWQPIALLGTAVAFVTGFKNNASYNRLWEARQIWGSIINSSRSLGILFLDLIRAPDGEGLELAAVHKRLFYRHFAWLTALRFQLREPRAWENMSKRENIEYRQRTYHIPELDSKLDVELKPLLDEFELAEILAKKNRATHLIALQSREIAALAEAGALTELRQLEIARALQSLYDHQGRCERIKNFPYPRQFATLNLYFIWLFVLLMSFPLLAELEKIDKTMVWLAIPLCSTLSWVFHTMDKIGDTSENPFEGGPNDVPITAMSRTIEIDLREMLGESNIPPAHAPVHHILL